MVQEVVSTRISDAQGAADDLFRQLRGNPDSYNAVIFMAAIKYDFAALSIAIKEKFPNSEVIGASTAGEIDTNGFQNDSVVLTTMSDSRTRVKGVLVENGSKYPVGSKADIEAALRSAGISCGDPSSHQSAFAVAFINGVFNAEETILSAFLFVKTPCKFDIRQEDIFNPTGKTIYVTRSDTINRTIYSLNGQRAKSVYAQQLGVSESQAEGMTFENPFGRHINGSIHIAALAGFAPDGSCSLFARVVPNSTLEMMHIGDPEKKCDETCSGIKAAIPSPKFTLLMTCITRTMAFDRMGIADSIIRKYRQTFPTFCGFSCYGEQIGRVHCNQTLVSLVMGD